MFVFLLCIPFRLMIISSTSKKKKKGGKFAGKSYCREDHLNKFTFLARKKEKLKKTKKNFHSLEWLALVFGLRFSMATQPTS